MFIEHSLGKRSLTRTLVCGVGINDATYQVTMCDSQGKRVICPYYQVWQSMLKRCYSTTYQNKYPTYIGCSVAPEWYLFSTFKEWMRTQNWVGKVLDKDLISQGNRQYSPNNCVFIDQEINKLLCLNNKARGTLPIGVSYVTRGNRQLIVAQCSFYGKKKHLGYFSNVEAAAEAYKTAKLSYIAELAVAETDLRIKQALLRLF